MATLQITCLGDFQIALDGRAPNSFLTDKTRALLVYLALEPQVHQRSQLTQLFWSGYSEESARNSLRQALHLLRQFLAEDAAMPWLLVTRQTVQPNPAASLRVDVTLFTKLLAAVKTHAHANLATCTTCLAGLRQAVDLYRSDFLAGLSAIDSAGFEEWRRITQEQLYLQLLDALNQLAIAAEGAGDTEGALQVAQRQLTLEPWLESAHCQIMRLLAQRGQRAAAEAQYQRCRQVLAEELGVEPEAETTALYEQIRKGGRGQGARGQEQGAGGRGQGAGGWEQEVEARGQGIEDRDQQAEDWQGASAGENKLAVSSLPSVPLPSVPLPSVPLPSVLCPSAFCLSAFRPQPLAPCPLLPAPAPRLGRNAGGRFVCRTEHRGGAIDRLVAADSGWERPGATDRAVRDRRHRQDDLGCAGDQSGGEQL